MFSVWLIFLLSRGGAQVFTENLRRELFHPESPPPPPPCRPGDEPGARQLTDHWHQEVNPAGEIVQNVNVPGEEGQAARIVIVNYPGGKVTNTRLPWNVSGGGTRDFGLICLPPPPLGWQQGRLWRPAPRSS